jgi:predicted Zn-dependent peptidase
MIEDNPARLAYYKFNQFYYGDNSYGWPIIWTEENILKFTQQDLVNYKNALYTKDNLVIVVAWKIINEDEILNLIWEKFGSLGEKRTIPQPDFPWITQKKEDFFKKWTQQNHLLIWVPGFSLQSDKKYIADVLATILWWNMSSVLFQEIREKLWLAYYISASHSSKTQDGLFLIRAGLDKKNFKLWKDKILEILQDFWKWNIPKEKFEKTKSYLIGHLQIWLETSDEVADFVVYNKLLKWKITPIEELIQIIKNISYEEVVQLAKEVFQPGREKVFWIE